MRLSTSSLILVSVIAFLSTAAALLVPDHLRHDLSSSEKSPATASASRRTGAVDGQTSQVLSKPPVLITDRQASHARQEISPGNGRAFPQFLGLEIHSRNSKVSPPLYHKVSGTDGRQAPQLRQEASGGNGRQAPQLTQETSGGDGRQSPQFNQEASDNNGRQVPQLTHEASSGDGRQAPQLNHKAEQLPGGGLGTSHILVPGPQIPPVAS